MKKWGGGGVGDARRLGCNSIILVPLRVLMKIRHHF